MAETQPQISAPSPTLPTSQDAEKEAERRNRQTTIAVTISAIIFVALIALAVFGLTRDASVTEINFSSLYAGMTMEHFFINLIK